MYGRQPVIQNQELRFDIFNKVQRLRPIRNHEDLIMGLLRNHLNKQFSYSSIILDKKDGFNRGLYVLKELITLISHYVPGHI